MTLRWIRGGGFELGIGFRWGDNRHRSIIACLHLGTGSVLGIFRWWL